jgi:dephospho-CoA kinase
MNAIDVTSGEPDSMGIVALTGPPAAGKSTIAELFRGGQTPVVRAGNWVREQADSEDEEDVWSYVKAKQSEHGETYPFNVLAHELDDLATGNDVCLVSGPRNQSQIDYLHVRYGGPVFVCRVDTRTDHTRLNRYVTSRIDGNEPVDRAEVESLQDEFYERQEREQPYPTHDVTLLNENETESRELTKRVGRIIEIVEEAA